MAHFPTYEMQYKIFRWTGMAKNDFQTRTQRFFYALYDVFITSSYLGFQCVFGFQLVAAAAEVPFEELVLNMVSFLMCLGVLAKRVLVLGKKQGVKELYLRLRKDFENPEIRDIDEADEVIRNCDRYYKKMTYIFYVVGFVTTILYSAPSFMNFPNELPFPLHIKNLTPRQVLTIIIWQSILVWVAFINYLSYDSLVWGFLMLIATRMVLIAKMCDSFTNNYPSIDFKAYIPDYEDYPKTKEKERANMRGYHSYDEYMRHDEKIVKDTVQFLKNKVVVYYQEITEEMVTVERLYTFPLLIHMVGGSILVGIMVVFIITGGFRSWYGYRTFIFFFLSLADLFNYSYYGTKVTKAKELLTASVYGCPWHEVDVSNGKFFMYTMSMMRKDPRFTAGGFVDINFESFLSLMKLSYNFLAVLS